MTECKVNQEFEYLKVISIRNQDVVCLCICGAKVNVNIKNLINGDIGSCGCEGEKTIKYVEKLGMKYNKLKIIKIFLEKSKVICLCICECGNKKISSLMSVIKQSTKHCGCDSVKERKKYSNKEKNRLKIMHIVQSMKWS